MLFPVVTSASWLIKGQSFSGYHIPCPLCFPGASLCILHHHFNSLFSIPSFSILSYLLPYKNSYFVYIFWQPLFLSVCLFRGISQNCLYRQFPILISALYLITMPFTAYLFSLNYVLLDPRDSSLLSVYRSPSSTWPWLITSPLLWTVSSLFFCDYIFSSHLSAHSFFWRLLSSPNSKSEYFPAFCLFVLVSFFFFFGYKFTLWLLFSCSFMSNSLRPCILQYGRLPCPSLFQEFAQNHVHWFDDGIQASHPNSH